MIGFRVDANEHIATGHLMRCIAIANACRKQGKEVLFLLAEEKEIKRLQEHNLPFRILHSKWNALETEVEVLKKIIAEEKLQWLVVDSYQATGEYLKKLNEQVPTLYIDDMGLEVYDVAAVLHYLDWQEEYAYRENYLLTDTKVLSGMQYAPLRDEFAVEETCVEREKSILITTGGTDTYNVTGALLHELIGRTEFTEYSFHVIVGSMNKNEEILEKMADEDARILLHKNVSNMSDYMKMCKLAVSAGGTTLFEFCACGTPTVCFSFADNQEELVNKMAQHQIMVQAGDARREKDIAKRICDGLLFYLQNEDKAAEYVKRMQDLVDGKGAKRIAKFLCEEKTALES